MDKQDRKPNNASFFLSIAGSIAAVFCFVMDQKVIGILFVVASITLFAKAFADMRRKVT